MTSPALPADLRSALDAKLEGLSRNDAAARAALISRTYRSGGGSDTIKSDIDALAYAMVRMPATYAATAASLDALRAARPDFTPQTLLDVGAGPGTASWAASEAFSSLRSFALIDANPALRTLALDLARTSARFDDLIYDRGDGLASVAEARPRDLVVASYVLGELGESDQARLVEMMWSKTRDALLIVEPGTPAGYARIVARRRQLIAAGAHVAAPCPHDRQCPLAAPDWCHFAQRLPRLRAHMQVKGAELPFEDEKFSYVALARTLTANRPAARVLAPPLVGKVAATAKLCSADGTARMATIPRRDKRAFAAARRWDWGDGVDPQASP
jgi:ribosomal protein RSM22 (predicted rRNA methylase)